MLPLILIVLTQTTPPPPPNAGIGVRLEADRPVAHFLPGDVELPGSAVMVARVAGAPLAVGLGGGVGAIAGLVIAAFAGWFWNPQSFLVIGALVGGALGSLAGCVIGSSTPKDDLLVALPVVLSVFVSGVGLVLGALAGFVPLIPAIVIASALVMATPVVTTFAKRWAAREEYGIELATF